MREEHIARWYHLILYPDWLRKFIQPPGKVLPEFVAEGMKVADIGCGLGLYAIELAKRVGDGGKVYAVDLQPQMLRFTERKAKRARLLDRIELIQCTENDLRLPPALDFIMTMNVTHEVTDRAGFFTQLRDATAENAKYLLVEPIFHVKQKTFDSICDECQSAGFKKQQEIKVPHSRAVVFAKALHGSTAVASPVK